jgi:hypothetical protein
MWRKSCCNRKEADKMKKLFILILLFLYMVTVPNGWCEDNVPLALADARKKIQSEFARLDAGLNRAAMLLGESGLTGEEARMALRDLCGSFSYAVDCTAVDPHGIMTTVEPAAYRRFEGNDISGQEQVKRVMQDRKPVLSNVFMSVEGFAACDAEYPVTTRDGRLLGSVSLLFKPDKFLGDIIRPLIKGIPMDIWVMYKNGRILYDVDRQQIGLNLFTSPLYWPYSSLLELGRQIVRNPSGAGNYTFLNRAMKKDVTKNSYWQTVSMYGTDWRLVGIHIEPKKDREHALQAKALKPDRPLDSLAASKAFTTALARGDRHTVMKLFRKFREENPGIYSIQWIDKNGINLYGHPEENSLRDYDFRSNRAQSDQPILQVVREQIPAVLEYPLFEGNAGIFTLRPVFSGKRYLGTVYVIVLK